MWAATTAALGMAATAWAVVGAAPVARPSRPAAHLPSLFSRSSHHQLVPLFLLSLVILSSLSTSSAPLLASAECECGYTSDVGADSTEGGVQQAVLFTDLLETNFLNVENIHKNEEWLPQVFNWSAERARGPYGQMSTRASVITDRDEETGLMLTVDKEIIEDMITQGEVATARRDVSYGTFRASIKLTKVEGTCAAFFWYHDDAQEIDLEFLSREFNFDNHTFIANLVVHSPESANNGFDAKKTGNAISAELPFDPTSDYHEYRIDFVPDRVIFYADGIALGSIEGDPVPEDGGGALVFSHWSNGNENWSAGPPKEDANVHIRYVKAYFNSSDSETTRELRERCDKADNENKTCVIPALTVENKETTSELFFEDAAPALGALKGAVWAVAVAVAMVVF